MGLDITAYRKLTKVEDPIDYMNKDGNVKNYTTHLRVSISSDFPSQAEGLEDGAIYIFSKIMSFRAGSYSGYNSWRDHLAIMAGYSSARNAWHQVNPVGPFVEIINFTDCDGIIGPVVSKKLAQDFADHQPIAEQYAKEHNLSWWLGLYTMWRKAFVMAADDGAIEFH